MFQILTSAIGAVIAVMAMINSMFAVQIGYLPSILVIHFVGLLAVSIVLVVRREINKSHAPAHLYLSGVLGVLLIFSNNFCFQLLGVSLTLSLSIVGQTIGSLFTDSIGFLGMNKYSFRPKKIFAILVSFLGAVLMIEEWHLNLLIAVIAFFTGMLVLLIMILNTQLALRIGVFRGTRINFLSGLFATVILIIISKTDVSNTIDSLSGINPVLLFGGGILGVVVVACINYVFPRIPTVSSTLLIVIGQLSAGLIIDYLIFDIFSLQKLCGIMMVLIGVAMNQLITSEQVCT